MVPFVKSIISSKDLSKSKLYLVDANKDTDLIEDKINLGYYFSKEMYPYFSDETPCSINKIFNKIFNKIKQEDFYCTAHLFEYGIGIQDYDIVNQYRQDYVPFFKNPSPLSYTLGVIDLNLSSTQLNLARITSYDLQKNLVIVDNNKLYFINRDSLNRGDYIESPHLLNIQENILNYLSNYDLTDSHPFDLSIDVFKIIIASEKMTVKSKQINSASIRKTLNPFLGYLVNKRMGELTQEETDFIIRVIRPEIFNRVKLRKTKSLSQMNDLIYNGSTFTDEFVRMLRQQKDFLFTNPESTIGAFPKLLEFMKGSRWLIDKINPSNYKFTIYEPYEEVTIP